MWTEKRLLKALASEFKEAIQHNKKEIEQTTKETTVLIIGAKTKHSKAIIEKRSYVEGCRKEINDFMALIEYMNQSDAEIPAIYGVSPATRDSRSTHRLGNDTIVSDKISVVMKGISPEARVWHKGLDGYFAMEANMGDAFLDNDTSKLATAYVKTFKACGEMDLHVMVNNLVMYHFLRKQFVRLRGNQAVNFIRGFRGETIVLGDELAKPYIVRKIVIEKVKKTKRGKVTLCHLHLNRPVNDNSDSITLNICHRDSYYRDDGHRHMWARTNDGFHPVICTEKAILNRNIEEFVAGY